MKGLALIVVAAVLAILSVMATAFVTLTQIERRAAEQRLLSAKASLLARTGVEDALARISEGQDVAAFVGGGSGGLSADLAAGGNVYAFRVEDESSKINVNGGFLDAGDRDLNGAGDGIPDHRDPDVKIDPLDPKDTGLGWNFQLMRILGILGNQPEVGLPTLGTDVLALRPAGGYASIQALQLALGTAKDLSPWLTVSSWSDAQVVHPNAYEAETVPFIGWQPDTPNWTKLGRTALRQEIRGRSPVNLNAASRPVLVALIQGLRSKTWREIADGYLPATTIPPALAGQIADALIAARPFRTWNGFSAFCDSLVQTGVITGFANDDIYDRRASGANFTVADLLKANFNPNTDSNKELPDWTSGRWVDKTDLLTWSTEGCLESTGRIMIQSTGRVLDPARRAAAKATVAVSVEVFRPLRQTTQADFVAGRTALQDYLSLSNGAERTTGTSTGAAWWGGTPPGLGLAVTTRPCPIMALPTRAADFDGALTLATVDFPEDIPALRFLHHFDDGWDAETLAVNPLGQPQRQVPGLGNCDILLQTSTSESVWPAPPIQPNTLYPDGAHIQYGRAPAYLLQGNFPSSLPVGDHGVFSYWVKSAGMQIQDVHLSISRGPNPNPQMLQVFRSRSQWTLTVDFKNPGSSYRHERDSFDYPASGEWFTHDTRWALVTALFDTDAASGEAVLNVRKVTPESWNMSVPPSLPTAAVSFAEPGNMMILGGEVPGAKPYSDHILDEFALLDFTDDAAAAAGDAQGWATNRYADGRYYRGGDGAFLSGILKPDSGRLGRILRTAWTAYLPGEIRLGFMRDGLSYPPETGTPRVQDLLLADGPGGARLWMEVDLLQAGEDLSVTPYRKLAQGATWGPACSDFRYRVRFRNALDQPLDDPILETPVFDDITFAWQARGGPKILSWRIP